MYISTDSLLHAIHSSYDEMLMRVETGSLVPRLMLFLDGLRARLAAGAGSGFREDVQRDLDLHLAVARALLTGQGPTTVLGTDPAPAAAWTAKCAVSSGTASVVLFGETRTIDSSQCEPRGHYTETPQLGRYFQAMMWLGRIDLRLLATDPRSGKLELRRREVEATLALAKLADGPLVEQHQAIDGALRAFVGAQDDLTLEEVPALVAALGAASPEEAAKSMT